MPRSNIFAGGKTGRFSEANPKSINGIITDYKNMKTLVDQEALALCEEAAKIVLDATRPHVPVQYGGLRESGRSMAVMTPKGPAAKVSFGGADAPVTPTPNAPNGIVDYAVLVHEDMERSSGPKFLEIGIQESRDEVDALFRSRLKAG